MDNTEKKLTRKEKRALKKSNHASSDKKGILLIWILSVVALILIANAVKIQTRKNDDDFSAFYSDTTQSTVATIPTVTETTTMITTQAVIPTTTEPENTQTTATSNAEVMTNQEILDIVTNGINKLKSADASFSGHKEQKIDMELTECSAPAFSNIVNKIIDVFVKTEIYDYDFTDGKGIDPESKTETTTMDVFPPVGKNFSLTIDGVAEATKEVQGENTVYKVKLKPEKSTKENPKTVYHENACDTLDLSSFSLPLGEITKADLEYPGATVGITIDKDGKVVGYYERLDIIGIGEAAAAGVSGGGTVEGYIDETWTIEWK